MGFRPLRVVLDVERGGERRGNMTQIRGEKAGRNQKKTAYDHNRQRTVGEKGKKLK